MNKLLRDCDGSSLVEFTLVFPVFMLVAFGTVDVSLMLFDWAQADKAAFIGARTAVVSNPLASGINNLTYANQGTQLGQLCFTSSGTANASAGCPTVTTVCTPGATVGTGTCSGGYTYDDTALPTILANMQIIFPRIGRQNMQISYQTTGLGFVGRPNGLPMNVTVTIRCMTHQLYFLGALMQWTFPSPPSGCPAVAPGPAIPSYSTTLPSEAL